MSAVAWQDLRRRILDDPDLQAGLWQASGEATFRERLTALGAPADGAWPWAAGPLRVPGTGAPLLDRPPSGPGWIPAMVETSFGAASSGERVVAWTRTGGEPLSQPFFAGDMQRLARHPLNRFLDARTGLDALPAGDGPEPAGIILHMSRCGSTLACNMLAALPGVTVLSEPQPLGAVSRAGAAPEVRANLLRRLLAAINHGLAGPAAAPLVLKLEARAVLDFDVFRLAFPGVPWVFIHRDPLPVLASQAAQPGPEMIPGMVDWDLPGLTPQQAAALNGDAYRARVLAAICTAAAERLAEGAPAAGGRDKGGLAIDYRDLPEAAWAIAGHFDLAAPAAFRATALARAAQDAKRPDRAFDPLADARRGLDDPTLRALADREVRPAYQTMLDTAALARASAPRPAGAPFLQLPIRFDAGRLRAELAGLTDVDWIPHFNRGYYEGDWSGLPLRSVGGSSRDINPHSTDPAAYADTVHLSRLPYVREVLAAFAMPLRSVRLLKLAARSDILEHTDEYLGYADGQVRFHIPIVTSPLVEFRVAGERLVMTEGSAWYIDFNHPHSVRNQADVDRVHLVIDGLVSPWVAEVLGQTAAGANDPK